MEELFEPIAHSICSKNLLFNAIITHRRLLDHRKSKVMVELLAEVTEATDKIEQAMYSILLGKLCSKR